MYNLNRTERSCLIVVLVALMMAICVVMGFISFLFYDELFPPHGTPTASVVVTNIPPGGDPVWNRIQETGKIVVGTSADYPPFSYVEGNNTFQGYDIALIQEIGRRLNLGVEIKNMAFDGLGDALQLGQIDVALGAISVTPGRDALIDFSNVYYVSEDAVVADRDDNVIVTDVNSMANIRVGVQRGSSYETWLQQTLVQPGLMPPQYLIPYGTADEALQALLAPNPQITLVLMDLLPAEVATQQMNVKIVQRGLDPQNYAIAIPSGAYTLQANLNQVLTLLQSDGTLSLLAQYYLNISNPPTPPPPQPTQPPATPSACLDGMAFIADINYPDNNMTTLPVFPPGTVIQKGWRIRNTGTCTWNSSYFLVYSGSNPPNAPVSGNPVPIQGTVAPGATYDIYASITAPGQPGRYQSFWMMRNASGKNFGERLWAGFQVIGDATPTSSIQPTITLAPTQDQPPAIYTFSIDNTEIELGSCVNLFWAYGGSSLVQSQLTRNSELIMQDLPLTGSKQDCPPSTGQVEYKLKVDSEFSGSVDRSIFLNVLNPLQ